jgi:hypothetical protein
MAAIDLDLKKINFEIKDTRRNRKERTWKARYFQRSRFSFFYFSIWRHRAQKVVPLSDTVIRAEANYDLRRASHIVAGTETVTPQRVA